MMSIRAYTCASDSPDAQLSYRGVGNNRSKYGGGYRGRTKKEVRPRRKNSSYSTELVSYVKDNCTLHGTGGTMTVREIAREKDLTVSWVRAVASGKIRVNG